jgi:hypothetical protein
LPSAKLPASTKECLFIDGLDEYKGNPLDLIEIIRDLASVPDGDIKLCVSSRPWTAFRNAFEARIPNLRVEDLSRPDIHHYVDKHIRRGLLQAQHDSHSSPISTEALDLIEEIAERAEGVFLWVMLVVLFILRGIAERDPIWMLLERVRSFPADLDEFFRDILRRVDSVYAAHTHQALKLACLYADADDSVSLSASFWDYWFIRQSPYGLSDPSFVNSYELRVIEGWEWEQMVEDTKATLSSACKDLLWIPEGGDEVYFLHRTLYDFLTVGETGGMVDNSVPTHFLDGQILRQLNWLKVDFMKKSDNVPGQLHLQSAAETLRPVSDHSPTENYMQVLEQVVSLHNPSARKGEYAPLQKLCQGQSKAFGLAYVVLREPEAMRQLLKLCSSATWSLTESGPLNLQYCPISGRRGCKHRHCFGKVSGLPRKQLPHSSP